MAKRFTFKTEKPTGRYRSFYPNNNIIKYNKKEVGTIADVKPYKILLHVKKKDIAEDGNPNCVWKNIVFTKKSSSLEEAKIWLNNNIEEIMNKYELYAT